MARVRYSFSSRHTGRISNIRKQKEKFPSVLKKMIDKSDIVLQVLDSRFIEETRNHEVEKYIKKQNKRIIYVLNKSDLIDKSKVSKSDLKEIMPYVFVSAKNREGSRPLKEKIKIEAKKVKEKVDIKIQVGIMGYPNTGKSSIINFLKGRASAKSSSVAGYTRGLQKINLTSKIALIDSPGVIPESMYSPTKIKQITQHAKVGARDANKVRDPEIVLFRIIDEYKDAFEKHYNQEIEDIEEFIREQGAKKGFLKKGGKTDMDKASRAILREWQDGTIKIL